MCSDPSKLQKRITLLQAEMTAAAKEMNFLEAARLRDELLALEDKMKELNPDYTTLHEANDY